MLRDVPEGQGGVNRGGDIGGAGQPKRIGLYVDAWNFMHGRPTSTGGREGRQEGTLKLWDLAAAVQSRYSDDNGCPSVVREVVVGLGIPLVALNQASHDRALEARCLWEAGKPDGVYLRVISRPYWKGSEVGADGDVCLAAVCAVLTRGVDVAVIVSEDDDLSPAVERLTAISRERVITVSMERRMSLRTARMRAQVAGRTLRRPSNYQFARADFLSFE